MLWYEDEQQLGGSCKKRSYFKGSAGENKSFFFDGELEEIFSTGWTSKGSTKGSSPFSATKSGDGKTAEGELKLLLF